MKDSWRVKLAFSLAEVLVTLAVIGVIATLTIPTLLQNKQKQDTVARLQKAYTTLAQAIKRSEIDNGPLETWDYTASTHEHFANTYILPYLNIIKNCGTTENGCWSENKFNLMNGNTVSTTGYAKAVLNDGTFLLVDTQGSHAHFVVDIDGFKGPNRYGRDVFTFTITPKSLYESNWHKIDKPGLYPQGAGISRNDILNNSCNKNTQGYACVGLIVQDGWQIKDDYPW